MNQNLQQKSVKTIVVLARRDPAEAMRVAAGLSIFDHRVSVVLTQGPLEITDAVTENAELLELSDIEVRSLVDDPQVPPISMSDLSTLIEESDFVATI